MRDRRLGMWVTVALAAALTEDTRSARADPGSESRGDRPEVTAAEFDPATVRLHSQSQEYRALEALQANRREQALQMAEEALQRAQEPALGRLRWIASRASRDRRGEIVHLKALGASAHPLAPWAKLRLVEALRQTDPGAAVQLAHQLLGPWAGRGWARSVYALALADAGRNQQAEPLLRELITFASDAQPLVDESLALARILEVKPATEARREALRLYRQVAARAPSSELGKKARLGADRMVAILPKSSRAAVAQPSIDELFRQGQALVDQRRYAAAETLYAKLVDRLRDRPAERCRALFRRARALESDRKRIEAAPLFVAVASGCADSELKISARYYAGQTLLRAGKPEEAIDQLDTLARLAPHHRLADDALYKAAVAAEDVSGRTARTARLEALLKRYPDGDMRATVQFELALNALSAGDATAALQYLDRLAEQGAGEIYEGMRGRAAYWRARALRQLSRTGEAIEAFQMLARDLPLSYYAQQALIHLSELDKDAVQELLEAYRDREPLAHLSYALRPEMRTEGFTRAVELLRLGEPLMAKKELTALGILGDKSDKSWSWMAAAMLYFAGDYTPAVELARKRFGSIWNEAPTGKAHALWRIAFPRAFAPLIEDSAKAAQVPPALVRAIAREESSFDARSVSPANAYGLIQLIVPTARQHARALGLPSDPESLKKPDINLRIGIEFLRFLFHRYPDNTAVVPAAYNAGYLATDRWLKTSGDIAFDEWVERIPYFETRNYTRRVLQSYGIYSWLDQGVLPPIPNAIPKINE